MKSGSESPRSWFEICLVHQQQQRYMQLHKLCLNSVISHYSSMYPCNQSSCPHYTINTTGCTACFMRLELVTQYNILRLDHQPLNPGFVRQ